MTNVHWMQIWMGWRQLDRAGNRNLNEGGND
ncbi:hypothetical protein Mal15_27790 [Stieleria maiorica]|uniref:Uncharacterized protein n=1 Tax=Stieleria maiorica TaxID=2795974 RepID=A0A5B9MGL4_9BACT|nr:hypothetical protein Mal15_27790 [Stieleria maiorica]